MVNPSAPAGKSLKYALVERERRFLLAEKPAGEARHTARITDHYLVGTRLRVRRMVETGGGEACTVHKLTQKVPAPGGGPGLLTTIYLDEGEYEMLRALPAHVLRKTRYRFPPLGVDVFAPPLEGLVLAEAEFGSEEEMAAFAPPPFVVREVTGDPRFTGGRLATTTGPEMAAVLAGELGLPG